MSLIDSNVHKKLFCFPIKEYYKKLSLPIDDNNFSLLCSEFIAHYNNNWMDTKLQKNASIVIDTINNQGKSQSILSAQENAQLHKFTNHFKINNYFKNIIGLNNNKAEGKLESGYKLIDKLNIPKEEILLIGDTNYDYFIAKKIGIDCILYYSGHQSKKILQKTSLPIIDNLKTILNII